MIFNEICDGITTLKTIKIGRIIAFLLIFLIISAMGKYAVEAVKINFQWTGEKGYSAEGIFSYEQKFMPNQITEQGIGKMNTIDNLTISFYNPSGKLLGTYDNIKQGISQDSYFKFNFDPQRKKVTGLIDLGGFSANEIYLKGVFEDNLTLFKIDKSGKEKVYDHD